MLHSVMIVVSWAAVTAGTLGAMAQYRRVGVLGIEGVSVATWLLFTLLGGFWIAYGTLVAHSWAVVLGSVLCWPFQMSVVFRLAPWRHPRETLRATALFLVTCVAPGALGGWSYCVYGCGVAMVLLRLPQIAELVRTRDASGVSAASWFFGVGCAVLWIAYYADIGLWAPLIATTASGAASVAVASLTVWRHRQADRDVVRREVFAVS